MRVVPRSWDNETWICSIRGHVAPAAHTAELADGDAAVGVVAPDGTRLSRCLRCDLWVRTRPPQGPEVARDRLGPVDGLPHPRRGKALEDAIIVRLIAVERFLHFVLFSIAAVVLFFVETDLAGLRRSATDVAQSLQGIIDNSGRGGSHSWLVRHLRDVGDWHDETIRLLLVVAVLYAVVEGTEAVGLWFEQRWAEYLTVVATAGFLPFEVHELTERVTILRVLALLVNVAVLIYLVWAKRLFGLRGGTAALRDRTDWDALVAAPPPPVDQARC